MFLQHILLRDVIVSSSIYYDPENNIHETQLEEDRPMLEIYREFLEIEMDSEEIIETAPWIIRLVFDKEILMAKNITMSDIQDTILNNSQFLNPSLPKISALS